MPRQKEKDKISEPFTLTNIDAAILILENLKDYIDDVKMQIKESDSIDIDAKTAAYNAMDLMYPFVESWSSQFLNTKSSK